MNKLLLSSLLLAFSFFQAQKNLLNFEGVPFLKNQKWGIMNIKTKEFMIEPKYDRIGNFEKLSTNLYPYYNQDGKMGALFYGEVDNVLFKGEFIPAKYESIENIYNNGKYNGYVVYENNKAGLYNNKGELVIPVENERIYSKSKKNNDHWSELSSFYIVEKENNTFSSGIFDLEKKQFLIKQNYNISNLNWEVADSIVEKLKVEIYDYLLTDNKNQNYVVDYNFNLIKVNVKPDEYQQYGLKNQEGINTLRPILYGNPNYLDTKCETLDKKNYKTDKKNSYTLTNTCLFDYQIIVSKNEKKGLLAKKDADFKKPSLEPVFNEITTFSVAPSVYLITNEENGKHVKGLYRPKKTDYKTTHQEYFLEPSYQDIKNANNFIELTTHSGKKDFLFLHPENIILHKINASEILPVKNKDCSDCPPDIYKIIINQNLFFYMDGDGFLYYQK